MKFETEDDELEFLAETTPTKFSIMTITDVRSGMVIRVDQSLDSGIMGTKDTMLQLLEEFLNIYFYTKDKKYTGEFDGKNKVKINNLMIDFDKYQGEVAWIWLVRYIKVVVNLMNKNGVIDLKKLEEDNKGVSGSAILNARNV